MTTDGSEDNKITIEGLKDYKTLPQLNIPSVGAEPESNPPDSSNGEDEDHKEVLDGDIEHPPNEGFEWGDLEIDRSYDDELCERKRKALYDDAWLIGKIKYRNEIMTKYRVIHSDGSEDYISVEDIDGVEIMLID